MNIAEWLRNLGMERYAAAFAGNGVDDRSLGVLTADDLKEIGVKAVGHRRIILEAIAVFRDRAAESPQSVAERRQLTVLFCDLARATINYAREKGIQLCEAEGMIIHGWARVSADNDPEVLTELNDGIGLWRTTGAKILEPYYLYLLASARSLRGDVAGAKSALNEALAVVEDRGERWWQPEIIRLLGQIRLADGAQPDQVVTDFERALHQAQDQQSRSLELLAAISLASVLQQTDDQQQGLQILRRAYEEFDEGFETFDLARASGIIAGLPELLVFKTQTGEIDEGGKQLPHPERIARFGA